MLHALPIDIIRPYQWKFIMACADGKIMIVYVNCFNDTDTNVCRFGQKRISVVSSGFTAIPSISITGGRGRRIVSSFHIITHRFSNGGRAGAWVCRCMSVCTNVAEAPGDAC